jgi:cytochrome c5
MSDHHAPSSGKAANPVKIAIFVVIGALVLIVGIVLLAQYAVGGRMIGATNEKANSAEATARNIAPVTSLQVDASKGPMSATATAVVATTPTKTVDVPIVAMAIPVALPAGAAAPGGGEGTYNGACFACHSSGAAGAPKVGDKGAWAPRIAQGKDTLYEHAINGYNGKAGAMPAKGGNASLADADVKAAVDYMVALAK